VGVTGVRSREAAAAEISWRLPSAEDMCNRIAVGLFDTSSYLIDPVTKSHECYWRMLVVDELHGDESPLYRAAAKSTLALSTVGWGGLAIFAALPGLMLLGLAIRLQSQPFIYVHEGKDMQDKKLPTDRSFTLFSWNVCCVGGGKSISHGGVVPRDFRIDAIIDKILEKDADVNCLYEVFDQRTGDVIRERLKDHGYRHFYYNIGPRTIGTSSGMFVASKYAIEKPKFTAFPPEALVGTASYCGKGVFGFDLCSKGKSFARIHASHLNHSEVSGAPEQKEIEARVKEFAIMMKKVQKVQDIAAIITGDFNLGRRELESHAWYRDFDEGTRRFDKKTWGGDAKCASWCGEKHSDEMDLDYTMAKANTVQSLVTDLVDTGYNQYVYKPRALSDHHGLFSEVTVLP
jgi:hypothetical protein